MALETGAYLVGLARRSVSHYFETGSKLRADREDGELGKRRGVFVTLESYPSHELRGCIGLPLPIKELAPAVVDSALSAAFEDYRFPHLEKEELSSIVFEVSVLTEPAPLRASSPEDYLKKIKIGRDGLMIEYGRSTGLFLPQVPIEWNWNETEYLRQLCQKAGLPPDMWRSPSVVIKSFEASIFCEEKPGGRVLQKKLVR